MIPQICDGWYGWPWRCDDGDRLDVLDMGGRHPMLERVLFKLRCLCRLNIGRLISSSGFSKTWAPHSNGNRFATHLPINNRPIDSFMFFFSPILKSNWAGVLKLKEESLAKSYHHLWTYDGAGPQGGYFVGRPATLPRCIESIQW